MDPSAHHPDPFGEALSFSSQKSAQFISLVTVAAEVAARRKAVRAARQATRDQQQRRAARPGGHLPGHLGWGTMRM